MKTPPRILIVVALLAASSAPLHAEQNAPHIGFVYPAGGRQGDTFEVEVGGQFLDGVRAAYVSGGGAETEIVELVKPLPGDQVTELRNRIQELQKKGKDAGAQKEIEDIRRRIADSLNRSSNPSISQRVTVRVSLRPGAEPGRRELRLKTPLGLSNPLVFCVGQLPEFREKDPKTGPEDAMTSFTLPAVLNGRLVPGSVGRYRSQVRQQLPYVPGDVDRYRFSARKGQRLVAAVSARELIPYLPDAVPGWIQAVLALDDASGREVAYDDDFRFHPDPVLYYEVPEDGDYTIEIRDALYRGRDDFVYRITIGEVPYITSIFPLGGRAGSLVRLQLLGWNLPSANLTEDARKMPPGIHSISSARGGIASNSVPFMTDGLPECYEKEPNDSPQKAQKVKLPVIVNGRIDRPGDWDVFRFKGRAGEKVVAETYARRLDSPLDSVIKLTDSRGRQLAYNDDYEDKGAGLETHHADSYISVALPADGVYYVWVGDAQHKGGPEYGYRLRISAPRPDFELRVTPSAVNALVGPTAPVTVYALRRDGFSGEIALDLRHAPAGLALRGGRLPAGQDRLQLTLTVPPSAAKEPIAFLLEGRAVIDGREVVRTAVPADDMMQAFAYRHLVPAQELWAAASGRGPSQAGLRVLNEEPLKIQPGGSVRVRVAMRAFASLEKVRFELEDPPEGITIRESSLTRQGAEFVLAGDAKAKPGTSGNIVVSVSGERTPPAKGSQRPQKIALGTLPALAFEVVRP